MKCFAVMVVCALIAAASTAPPASAQSRFCQSMQMELAQLDKAAPKSKRSQRALRKKLTRARAEARRAGCRNRLFSKNRRKRACRSILSRVNRLERRFSASRARGKFGFGRSSVQRRRNSIRQAMARAGCSIHAGTYRTICVRVCDGYYFPLTFAASRQRLATDAMKCKDRYGHGEATLYYYPNPGGDASQAVSLSGERYADQPYAFLFRRAFNPHCVSRLHAGLTTLGRRALDRLATPSEKFKTAMATRVETPSDLIPIARADWASDPETLFNRAGGFDTGTIGATPEAAVIASRNIRRVGDRYHFSEANPGPPATVAGYTPPEPRDFRIGMSRRGRRALEAESIR